MSVTSSVELTEPDKHALIEPETPGTSAKFTSGPRFKRYLLLYALATLGITAIWGGVLGILLPNHVQLIEFSQFFTGADAGVDLQALSNLKNDVAAGLVTPSAEQTRLLDLLAQFDSARAQSLSLVTAVAVAFTMFIQPIAGMLSDRTRSRHGRRAHWLIGGAVLGAALLIGVRFSASIGALVALWTLAQMVINIAQGPLSATIADRVVSEKVGTASAITGLGGMLGVFAASVVGGALFTAIGLDAYYPFAVCLIVLVVLFVVIERDRSSEALEVEPMRWGAFFKSFITPLRDSDYRWAWIAKLVLFFGYGVAAAFNIYMLQSYIRPAMSAAEATVTAPLISLAGMPLMVVGMLVCGRLSDKLQRRKPFVFWASILMATGMVLPLLFPSLWALFAQAILNGLAFGTFMVVDQALFIDIIVDKRTAGRDLGMANLGQNIGQALGPVVAGQVVVLTASYALVWAVAAAVVLIAAFAILPIKRVR